MSTKEETKRKERNIKRNYFKDIILKTARERRGTTKITNKDVKKRYLDAGKNEDREIY